MHNELDGMTRRAALQRVAATLVASGFIGSPLYGWAAAPNVIDDGKLPDDSRLGALKDYDGYFPFDVPESAAQWEQRAERVRRQMLVACGLWPMPTKTPIMPTIYGKIDRPEYTVEKVYFESFPGLYVTGSLYRSKDHEGPSPAILCPHGHWPEGRFHDHGEEGVKKEIAAGAEIFEQGGRHPLQARCVQLARMGCVVFLYDMLGYADGVPISFQLAHRFAEQRPNMSQPDHWGLFSAQAELRLLNVLGLQTLNSLRALDWITSLPNVDPDRIGVTGASGGGTQTFMLAAIDPRVTAAFPAVMVSTAMQGGCTCENATYLRVDTGNIEFAALIAPRPLGMSAANDWTQELETKGLPELQEHYKRLGAGENVVGKHFPFPHNYNAVSRKLMYEFFNQHFSLGYDSPIEEHDYQPLTVAEATVWDDEHPKPASDEEAELKLLRALDADSDKQIAALTPHDAESLKEYRRVIGGALEVMIGHGLPDARDIDFDTLDKTDKEGWKEIAGVLHNKSRGEALPAVFLFPTKWNRQVAIWVHEQGKAGLYGDTGEVRPEVKTLLDAGTAVAGLDVLYTGEFLSDGQALTQSRVVPNPRQFGGYTWGYNHPLFSQRVQDILTMVAFARNHESFPEQVHLAGLGKAGPWVAAAAALAGDAVDRVAIGTGGFRFATITDIRDPQLLPGAVKYGDLPALLSLIAPHLLWIGGEGQDKPAPLKATYQSANAANRVTMHDGADDATAMVKWLK